MFAQCHEYVYLQCEECVLYMYSSGGGGVVKRGVRITSIALYMRTSHANNWVGNKVNVIYMSVTLLRF